MERDPVGIIDALVWPIARGLLAGLLAAGVYYLLLEGSGPPVGAVGAGIGVFIFDARRACLAP